MLGFSLDNSVAIICGGASGLTGVLCLLALASLSSARTGDAGAERVASFVIALLALGLSLVVFWSAAATPAFLSKMVAATGVPLPIFQIPASFAAVVLAYLAWRFPSRDA